MREITKQAAKALFLTVSARGLLGQEWTVTLVESPSYESGTAHTGAEHILFVNYQNPGELVRTAALNAVTKEFISLHPSSFETSRIRDTDGEIQGGEVGQIMDAEPTYHAALWRGTQSSFVDLHPSEFARSRVNVVSNGQLGGSVTDSENNEKAALWNGTDGSYTNFHPTLGTYRKSKILALSSEKQGGQLKSEAVIWHGSADNFTRLAPFGGPSFSAVTAMTETMQGGWFQQGTNKRAALWEGSRETMRLLHPPTVHGVSEIRAMLDDYQIGYAGNHASLWRGSDDTWVDLHAIAVTKFGAAVTSSSILDLYKIEDEVFIVGSVYLNERSVVAIWHQVGTEIALPDLAQTKLANLSGRAIPGTGERAMIAGLVVDRGTEATAPLLLRGIGPALRAYGVNNALDNPRLSVRNRGGDLAAENGGWLASPAPAQIRDSARVLGAFALPESGHDASILFEAQENLFTVQLDDEVDSSGVGLIEIYFDDQRAQSGGLKNLSLRAFAGRGEAAGVAGFVLKNDSRPEQLATVLLRVIGPTMGDHGIQTFMPNPVLTLRNASGAEIVTVDDWGDTTDIPRLRQAMADVGAFDLPEDSLDAAVLVELLPGLYTLTAEDQTGASGVVLMEIYLVE